MLSDDFEVRKTINALSGEKTYLENVSFVSVEEMEEDLSNLKKIIVERFNLKSNSFYFGFYYDKTTKRPFVYAYKKFLFLKLALDKDHSKFILSKDSEKILVDTPDREPSREFKTRFSHIFDNVRYYYSRKENKKKYKFEKKFIKSIEI